MYDIQSDACSNHEIISYIENLDLRYNEISVYKINTYVESVLTAR